MDNLVQQLILGEGALRVVRLRAGVGTPEERLRFVQLLATTPNSVEVFNAFYERDRPVPSEMEDAIAEIIRSSTTLKVLRLKGGGFRDSMYHKVADAFRVNTSVYMLDMALNTVSEQLPIVEAFIDAMAANPDRPSNSDWTLFKHYPGCDFGVVRSCAKTKIAEQK